MVMHAHCHVNAAILPQALDLKAYKWVYFCLRRFEPSCDLTLTDGRGFDPVLEPNGSPITGCKVIAIQGQVSGFTANPSSSSGTGKSGEKIVSLVELARSDHARLLLCLLSYCYDDIDLGDCFVPSRRSLHQYKKTNPLSGWFFFDYSRVFTRIRADSCGLRGFKKLHKFAQFFSLCPIILSTPSRHANSKSASSIF